MILLEKFQPVHFELIRGEPSVAPLMPHLTEEQIRSLENAPYAYSATRIRDGKVVACAGVAEYWPNRGEAWAILTKDIGADLVAVTKMVKKFLAACPVRRIEAGVEVDFAPGHRWAQMLGFSLEAPLLRAYLPSGADCALYSRVRS